MKKKRMGCAMTAAAIFCALLAPSAAASAGVGSAAENEHLKESAVIELRSSFADQFTDVNESDWFYNAVGRVVENKLFMGTADKEFSPNIPMSRSMFVQVLGNFTKNYDSEEIQSFKYFLDTKSADWFYSVVNWAAENRIVSGQELGKFAPGAEITREEMVTMLFNYALRTGENTPIPEDALDGYTDKNAVSDWAVSAFRWAVSKGIIKGTTDTTLSPKLSSSRAFVAAMFDNALGVMKIREVADISQTPEEDYDPLFKELLTLPVDTLVSRYDIQYYEEIKDPDGFIHNVYKLKDKYENLEILTYNRAPKGEEPYFVPESLEIPVLDLFPEFENLTLGEVVKKLGTFSQPHVNSKLNECYISYSTQSLMMVINFDGTTGKITDKEHIRILTGSEAVQPISKDREFSVSIAETELFTYELPEEYSEVLTRVSTSSYDSATYFIEPISYTRYRAEIHLPCFVEVMDVTYDAAQYAENKKEFVETDKPVVITGTDSSAQLLKLNGRIYRLVIGRNPLSPDYYSLDPEVDASFKSLYRVFNEIAPTVKLNPEAVSVK